MYDSSDASQVNFLGLLGLYNLLRRLPLPFHIQFSLHNSVWPLSAPLTKTACVRLQPRASTPGPSSGQLPGPCHILYSLFLTAFA